MCADFMGVLSDLCVKAALCRICTQITFGHKLTVVSDVNLCRLWTVRNLVNVSEWQACPLSLHFKQDRGSAPGHTTLDKNATAPVIHTSQSSKPHGPTFVWRLCSHPSPLSGWNCLYLLSNRLSSHSCSRITVH